jgi:hypothetical protein
MVYALGMFSFFFHFFLFSFGSNLCLNKNKIEFITID